MAEEEVKKVESESTSEPTPVPEPEPEPAVEAPAEEKAVIPAPTPEEDKPDDSKALVVVESRKIEHHRRKIITSDPYVKVSAPQATLARTCVLSNSRNPKWEEHFNISIAHPLVNLEFQVKDDDTFGADVMGTVL